MGWVRVSDDFYDHHGHAPLELAAWGLWVWSLAWSNRNLTDGEVPWATVKRMDPDGDASGALIDAGRWIDKGDCIAIHDYLEYQPSAEQIRKKREKERERWHRRGSDPPPDALRDDSAAESDATPRVSQPQPSSSTDSEGARRRGKTAIGKDFTVTDEMVAWVLERYPQLDWNAETEKFVAWAKAKDQRYADWVQAWRNWMHRAEEKRQNGGRW